MLSHLRFELTISANAVGSDGSAASETEMSVAGITKSNERNFKYMVIMAIDPLSTICIYSLEEIKDVLLL